MLAAMPPRRASVLAAIAIAAVACGPAPWVANPIGAMRSVLRALDDYADRHPDRGFPETLAALESASQTSGFVYTPAPRDAAGRITRYTLRLPHARQPLFTDESTVIRRARDGETPPPVVDRVGDLGQAAVIGFSPDGESIAVIVGARAMVLDVATGRELRRLTMPADDVSFGVTAAGALLASRADVQRTLSQLAGSPGTVPFDATRARQGAFSPDGRWLGLMDRDAIRIWDLSRQSEARRLNIDRFIPEGMVFSAEGRWLIANGFDRAPLRGGRLRDERAVLRIWDVETGQLVGVVPTTVSVQDVRIAPGGRLALARSGSSEVVRIWDTATGTLARTLRPSPHRTRVCSIAFSADGRALAASGDEGSVATLWDLATGSERAALDAGMWANVGFSPDGRLLFARGAEEMQVWDAAGGADRWQIPAEGAPHDHFGFFTIAFSPDSRQVAISDRRSIRIWDATSGSQLRTLPRAGSSEFTQMLFAPDGRLLVVRIEGGTAIVTEAESGRELHRIVGVENPPAGLVWTTFSPDNRWVAITDRDGRGTVWDIAGNTQRRPAKAPPPNARFPLAVSAHARLLARIGRPYEGTIDVVDGASGEVVSTIPSGSLGGCTTGETVAFSPDARSLAIVGQDFGNVTSVWEVASGRQLFALPASAEHAVFSPDGRIVAAASLEGGASIRLWEASTGREQMALRGAAAHGDTAAIALSGDGRWVATQSADFRLTIWNRATGQPQYEYSLVDRGMP